MVDYTDFCKKFCEIEKKYKLFEVDYNGIQYWKYARYFVFNFLWEKLYGVCAPAWFDNKNQLAINKYNHQYQRFTDVLFHNTKIGLKKDILMFSFSRRVKVGKKFISPVTDEIALNLKRSVCIVETPYYGGFYRPCPIRGIKYYDVWDGIESEKNNNPPIARGQLRKQILSFFENELDIKFTTKEKTILVTNVNYFILYHDELMARYKKIINKVKPKVVLYTMSYISEWIILTETLKEMGIPGIEILHGYVDNNCVAYNYSEVGLNNSLPDYIFAYSQIQKDVIKWGIPADHVRVVGNPWLEKRKKEFLNCNCEEKRKKTITFISSGNQAIEKYLVRLAKHIDHNKYNIVFKLHPEEYASWRTIYQNLPNSIKIIDNNEKDIHFYLAQSDFVIGINSTALFEAAAYSCDIYILEEESCQSMNILLKAGRASLVHTEEELFSGIMSNADRKSGDKTSFYEEYAIENINVEIEKIIKERE